MKSVYLQYWEESERGWGVRPDGCSLHLTLDNHKSYVNRIYDDRDPNVIPDEYDRTVGDPIVVSVSDDIFNQVSESKSIRLMQNSLTNLKNMGEIKTVFEDEPFV